MHLHSVIVSYNRLELTKKALFSYIETVTVPYTLCVVDNASDDETVNWLADLAYMKSITTLILLPENRYPGYATNRGWEQMPEQTTLLHRGDNDFSYLPGWCEQVIARFHKPTVGQVGLRTGVEELKARSNVGGNNVIRRELWDRGLRYDERPWGPEYPPGWTEDSLFSPEVKKLGYSWVRVKKPCIVSLASGDISDDYYRESYRIRGIKVPGLD